MNGTVSAVLAVQWKNVGYNDYRFYTRLNSVQLFRKYPQCNRNLENTILWNCSKVDKYVTNLLLQIDTLGSTIILKKGQVKNSLQELWNSTVNFYYHSGELDH